MRRSIVTLGSLLQSFGLGKEKRENIFTSLWNKPITRDERVKEYIPEVLEESLHEQQSVLQESTSRDVIVELGQRVLRGIENKSPTPNIAPYLNSIFRECGAVDLISQRPLSYLLYPSLSSMSRVAKREHPHELIANFADNFRTMIEEVERTGGSIYRRKCMSQPQLAHNAPSLLTDEHATSIEGEIALTDASKKNSNNDNTNEANEIQANTSNLSESEHELSYNNNKNNTNVVNIENTNSVKEKINALPPAESICDEYNFNEEETVDVTMFVKVLSGMALANMRCGDIKCAVKCVDVALQHAKDRERIGGLLGLKAGLLVHQKQYELAAQCAQRAVAISENMQGYLHGCYALRMLHRFDEMLQLLEKGVKDHPDNETLMAMLTQAKNDVKLALPDSVASSQQQKQLPQEQHQEQIEESRQLQTETSEHRSVNKV